MTTTGAERASHEEHLPPGHWWVPTAYCFGVRAAAEGNDFKGLIEMVDLAEYNRLARGHAALAAENERLNRLVDKLRGDPAGGPSSIVGRAFHLAVVDDLKNRAVDAERDLAALRGLLMTSVDLVAESIGTPQYDFRARASVHVETVQRALAEHERSGT